jgi:hypothetical protein
VVRDDGSASPSLGWLGSRPHTGNCVLVTVATQGAVGLEKSRVATGRKRQRRVGRVAVTTRAGEGAGW